MEKSKNIKENVSNEEPVNQRKIMNKEPDISSFFVDNFYTIPNELTGTTTYVLENARDNQCFFLNGKIAENFAQRFSDYEKKTGESLHSKIFKVDFFDGKATYWGIEKTYKGIKGIQIIGDNPNYVKYDL